MKNQSAPVLLKEWSRHPLHYHTSGRCSKISPEDESLYPRAFVCYEVSHTSAQTTGPEQSSSFLNLDRNVFSNNESHANPSILDQIRGTPTIIVQFEKLGHKRIVVIISLNKNKLA